MSRFQNFILTAGLVLILGTIYLIFCDDYIVGLGNSGSMPSGSMLRGSTKLRLSPQYHELTVKPSAKKRVAIIYAGPTFHEEVTSAIACMLYDLGFYVMVYIEDGMWLLGHQLPFTSRRQTKSKSFYGQCVDEFVVIGDGYGSKDACHMKSKRFSWNKRGDVHMVVFVTYPMEDKGFDTHFSKRRNRELDVCASCILNRLKAEEYSRPIVMISHHSDDFNKHISRITLPYLHANFPPQQLVWLYLNDHLKNTMVQAISDQSTNMAWLGPGLNSSFGSIYPVMPLRFGASLKCSKRGGFFSNVTESINYAIQGRYGEIKEDSKQTGRNILAVMSCLRDYKKGGGASSQTTQHKPPNMSIHLIGHRLGPMDEENNLLERYSKERQSSFINSKEVFVPEIELLHHNDLPPMDFYTAICNGDFIVTATQHKLEYLQTRSTSTVPAAIFTQTPLVSTTMLFSQYPCLNDPKKVPMHYKFNHESSECESMRRAAALTREEYLLAQQEMVTCNRELWAQSLGVFQAIVEGRHLS